MSGKKSFVYFIEGLLNALEIQFEISGKDELYIKTEQINIVFKTLIFFENKSELIIESDSKQIIVWEDLWLTKTDIIKSRLNYIFGLSYRLPSRVCSVKRLSTPIATQFLDSHHLQGAAGFKLKYGLFIPKQYFRLLSDFILNTINPNQEEVLLAVMTFSSPKKFYEANGDFYSYELVRFAVFKGINMVGGFTKLLQSFIKEKAPGNIMTYVDAEWSGIESFQKLGFEYKVTTEPLFFGLNENLQRVKPIKECEPKVRNEGSHKFILTLHGK